MENSDRNDGGSSDTIPQRAPDAAQSQPIPGGQGGLFDDPHHIRGDLVMLLRSVNEGWRVPKALKDKAKAVVEEALDDPSTSMTAARTVVAMVQADVVALQAVDKIFRLDTGQSTENVAAVQYIKGIEPGDV